MRRMGWSTTISRMSQWISGFQKIASNTPRAALGVITQAKKEYPDADLQSVVEEMGTTLSGAVGIFKSVVNSIATHGNAEQKQLVQPSLPALERPAPIVNNGVVPSRGESLFRESQEGAAETTTEV